MKKWQFVLAALLIAILVVSGCARKVECEDPWGCAQISGNQTMRIAYVGPMTGDYAQFGIDMSRGAQIAVGKMPEIQGVKVELLIEDTQGSPEQGAAVANKLASDAQVVGISGHTFSGSTEVAIPIYEQAGIVMMSASATTPSLTELGSEVFNRVAFHDRMQAQYASEFMRGELGISRIAVMHDGGAYGKGLADMVAEFFPQMGGQVVAAEGITPGETDYSAPLAAIAANSPELIYFGGYAADAAVIRTQMGTAGMGGVILFGCDGTYGEDFIDLAGASAEGSYSTYVPIPESAAFAAFRQEYQQTYGEEQGKLSPFSPHSHDATAVILQALNKVAIKDGNTLIIPRKALADEVRATSDFAGLTGAITCSDTGECAAASIQFMKVQNRTWVVGAGR